MFKARFCGDCGGILDDLTLLERDLKDGVGLTDDAIGGCNGTGFPD